MAIHRHKVHIHPIIHFSRIKDLDLVVFKQDIDRRMSVVNDLFIVFNLNNFLFDHTPPVTIIRKILFFRFIE